MTATYDPDTPLSPVEAVRVARFGLDRPEDEFDRFSDAFSRLSEALADIVVPFLDAVAAVMDELDDNRAEVVRLRFALEEAQKR